MRFQEDVYQSIREADLVRAGERVLVAVSGGADSIALLRALRALSDRLGIALTVAHLDHGLRSEEGARDAEFVRQEADRLGLSAVVEGQQVEPRRGESEEAAARRVRYAFLGEAARANGCARIATGHTADDQAETVLLRLMRGAGPRGLAAIPAARALEEGGALSVVRPLLGRTRAEVLGYLDEIGAEYRTDLTNQLSRHLRNRVRHEIIPLLRSRIDPAAVRTLARLAGRARAIDDYLRGQAAELLERLLVEAGPGRVSLDAAGLAGSPAALAPDVLRLAIRRAAAEASAAGAAAETTPSAGPEDAAEAGGAAAALGADGIVELEESHIDACLALAAGPAARHLAPLPAGLVARRVGERLEILVGAAARPGSEAGVGRAFLSRLGVPGVVELTAGGGRAIPLRIRAERAEAGRSACGPEGRIAVEFDWDGISVPLEVRSRRRGDRIAPRGMAGSKSLQDLLVDRKVPWTERERVPIVADRDRVLWVVGHAVSREAPVTRATRRKLVLSCECFS